MISRCYLPSQNSFKNYGGRGISVCDRWRYSFANFLADMGHRPTPGHSIDRIDNDGNYEPGNCKWSTAEEQRKNQRRSDHADGKPIMQACFFGTCREWGDALHLTANGVRIRVKVAGTVLGRKRPSRRGAAYRRAAA